MQTNFEIENSVLDYSVHIFKGGWEGIRDTASFAWAAVTDPEVLFVPVRDILYDATLITMAHLNDNNDIDLQKAISDRKEESIPTLKSRELFQLLNYVKTNQEEYNDALQRMRNRITAIEDGLVDTTVRYIAATGPERAGKKAYAITSVLVPSWFAKGIGSAVRVTNNLEKYGTIRSPRVYHNTRWDDIKFPLPEVNTLSIEQVRSLSGTHVFNYVVLEDNRLILSNIAQAHPSLLMANGKPYMIDIKHPYLAKTEGVIGAGAVEIVDGGVNRIFGNSGHYLPINSKELKHVVENSFIKAGYLDAGKKFHLYDFKVINPKLSPIVTQKSLFEFGFNKADILYGIGVHASKHLSSNSELRYAENLAMIDNKLPPYQSTEKKSPKKIIHQFFSETKPQDFSEEIFQTFSPETKAYIHFKGTTQDREILSHVEAMQAYFRAKIDNMDMNALNAALKKQETNKMLQEATYAFSQMGGSFLTRINPGLGKFMKGASGSISVIQSIASFATNGFSFGGIGMLFSGLNVLSDVLSDDSDGLGEAIQALHTLLIQCMQMLQSIMDYMVKSDEYWRQYFHVIFHHVFQYFKMIFTATQDLKQDVQYIYLQLLDAINHSIKREQVFTLKESESYGQNRAQTIEDLNSLPDEAKRVLRELDHLIEEAQMPYLSGENLFHRHRTMNASSAEFDIYQLLMRGHIYRYIADMMSHVPEVKAVLPHFFEPLMFGDALQEKLRLRTQGIYHQDNQQKILTHQLDKLERFLNATALLSQHAPIALFKHSLETILNRIHAIQALNHYDIKLVDIIENRFWNPDALKLLTPPSQSAVENNFLQEDTLKRMSPSTREQTLRNYERAQQEYFSTYPKNADPLKPFFALQHAKLAELTPIEWSISAAHGGTAYPYPTFSIIMNKTQSPALIVTGYKWTAFSRECGSVENPIPSNKRFIWSPRSYVYFSKDQAYTAINSTALNRAVDDLKSFRQKAVENQQSLIAIQDWSQALFTLPNILFQACTALGYHLNLCLSIPRFDVHLSEISKLFDHDLSQERDYQEKLPNVHHLFPPVRVEKIQNTPAAYANMSDESDIKPSFEYLSESLQNRTGLLVWKNVASSEEIQAIFYIQQTSQTVIHLPRTTVLHWISEKDLDVLYEVNETELSFHHQLLNYPKISSLTDGIMLIQHVVQRFMNESNTEIHALRNNPLMARLELLLGQGRKLVENPPLIKAGKPTEVQALKDEILSLKQEQKILLSAMHQILEKLNEFTITHQNSKSAPVFSILPSVEATEIHSIQVWQPPQPQVRESVDCYLLTSTIHLCPIEDKGDLRVVFNLTEEDTYNHCKPTDLYCSGERSSFITLPLQDIQNAALSGFLGAVIPEAVGDTLFFAGFIKQNMRERIKLFTVLAIVVFCSDIGNTLLAAGVMQLTYSVLRKLGLSETTSRISAHTASFFANHGLRPKSRDVLTTAVHYSAGRFGLWAEKQIFAGNCSPTVLGL